MTKKRPEGIKAYNEPAGGWGALKAVAETLARQQVVAQGTATLLKANQPEGFDCPGCAWPDPKHTSSFEFCENGAKAITWESTANASARISSPATRFPNSGHGPITNSKIRAASPTR